MGLQALAETADESFLTTVEDLPNITDWGLNGNVISVPSRHRTSDECGGARRAGGNVAGDKLAAPAGPRERRIGL